MINIWRNKAEINRETNEITNLKAWHDVMFIIIFRII